MYFRVHFEAGTAWRHQQTDFGEGVSTSAAPRKLKASPPSGGVLVFLELLVPLPNLKNDLLQKRVQPYLSLSLSLRHKDRWIWCVFVRLRFVGYNGNRESFVVSVRWNFLFFYLILFFLSFSILSFICILLSMLDLQSKLSNRDS